LSVFSTSCSEPKRVFFVKEYLPLHELQRCQQVCKKWFRCAFYWRNCLDLAPFRSWVTSEVLDSLLRRCHMLNILSLVGCFLVTEAGFKDIPLCLVELNLSGCDRLQGLSFLTKLKSLVRLSISGCRHLPNSALQHVGEAFQLQRLSLSFCTGISDDGLLFLAALTNLTRLEIASCFRMTDRGFSSLMNLTCLKYLNLSSSQITNRSMTLISKMTLLECLKLANCRYLTDECSSTLSTLVHLSNLSIAGCSAFTDKGIYHITMLPRLQKLNLSYVCATDRSAENIRKNCTQLQKLVITFCPISISETLYSRMAFIEYNNTYSWGSALVLQQRIIRSNQ
jgi:Leucine-rich repeat (LRR) protein